MSFRLATVVSSNLFNFVNAHCYERVSDERMCIDKVNWITAHNYGKPKWHSFIKRCLETVYQNVDIYMKVVIVAFSQKPEDSRSKLCRIKSISNQLCMQNLDMIDGNKKKLWQFFFSLRVNFLIFENSPCAKTGTTGNGHNWEMKCTCSIYWWD